MKKRSLLTLIFILNLFLSSSVWANECEPPKIVFNNNSGNIFSEEQEMFLGEAIAQQVERDFRIIDDEVVNGYLRKIGDRLIKFLPATSLKFQFHVVDLPEVNAFAMAGGRIFVTRKLIAFVRNEDELAGVVAHELGHGIVRHGTLDMSRNFKKVLKIRSVGGRKDIFDKYNQFIENRNTKRIRTQRNHQGKQQIEADEIGVFAMNAAGYDPNAFTSAFDRLAETKGKTGNWFSDLFGSTSIGEKRLRKIIDVVKKIPAECIESKSVVASEEFEDWRTKVISFSNFAGSVKLRGLIRKQTLKPRLRDTINHLNFSPDGRYIIAQDNSSIFVIQKEPYKYLFRIDTPEANKAFFSPDSKSIVFNTPTMRVEKWSIETQKPTSIREVFVTRSCFQTALSKDGNTFACFSFVDKPSGIYVDLKLIDVRTNTLLLEKKDFFRPHPIDVNRLSRFNRFDDSTKLFQAVFNSDARYFVAARAVKHKSGGRGPGSIFGVTRDYRAGKSGTLIYDLEEKKELKIEKKLIEVISSPFAFISRDRIIGQNKKDAKKSGVFSFPSGDQIEKFSIKANSFSKPHKGNFVLVRPLKVAPVGVFDLQKKKLVIANKTNAFDVHGDVFVSENKVGELGLYSLIDDKQLGLINLPESRFGSIEALRISPDLNWLAVSDNNRGAIWSLYSGNRSFYVQSFEDAFFDKDGKVYSDFTKTKETKRQIAAMDLRTKNFASSKEVKNRGLKQYGRYLVGTKFGKGNRTRTIFRRRIVAPIRFGSFIRLSRLVTLPGTFEIRDVRSNELLWSRKFEKGLPSRYINPDNNTISFVWSLGSQGAKDLIKRNADLKERASKMEEKVGDYLVQVVEADTGKVIGSTMIETGNRSFRINRGEGVGKWFAAVDSQNRVLVYSLEDGELKQRFFGSDFSINASNNLIAVGNLSGEVIIYDLVTGRTVEKMSFDSPVVTAKFGKYGKKLLVLTSKQEAFVIDTLKLLS